MFELKEVREEVFYICFSAMRDLIYSIIYEQWLSLSETCSLIGKEIDRNLLARRKSVLYIYGTVEVKWK